MVPTTREEFKAYCLRALGEPVIRVNVSQEQLDDRIDEALDLFAERHFHGTYKTYVLYDITEQDILNGYLKLDKDIIAVTSVMKPTMASGWSPYEYQAYINELYQYTIPYTTSDMSYYFISQSYLSLINRFFNVERNFTYNRLSNKVFVAGGLKDAENVDGGVVLEVYRKLNGEDDVDTTTNEIVDNIWKDKWLSHYATALIKYQWGQNLSKYQNVQLIGGISLNGDQIKQEAKDELEQLKQQLQSEYELPVDILWG